MVTKADVVVENFRPDVKSRLGIDYDDLNAINPRIVYASISGFGQDGPYRERPGFDQIAQGMGGLMSVTGLPGQGPVRVGIPSPISAPGIFCAYGITVALLEREVSGKGQFLHTSLLQAQIFMMDFQASRWLMDQEVPKQAGNNHPTSIPTGVFKTSDGYINIAVTGHKIWERFCKAIAAEELLANPDYAKAADRSKNRDALNADIERRLAGQSSDTWIAKSECRGRAVRPDLQHAAGLLGSAGGASEAVRRDRLRARQGNEIRRPAGAPVAHAQQRHAAAARSGRAHRRDFARIRLRRCRELPPCARAALSDHTHVEGERTMTDKMLSRKEGAVGWMIFNNPERHNAVSLDMWEAAEKILGDFSADDKIRVIVIRGNGGKAFVSGADISKFEASARPPTVLPSTTPPPTASIRVCTACPSRPSP